MRSYFILFTVLFAITGCASNYFKRLDSSSIHLGHSDRESVIEAIGNPQEGRIGHPLSPQGVPVEEVTHYIAKQAYFPSVGTIRFYREQTLVFHNGVLVGFTFVSGSPAESTFFDMSKVKNIFPGRTTMEQVINLLGQPAGERIYPMTCSNSAKDLIYKFYYRLKISIDENANYNYASLSKLSRALIIHFDNDGVVIGISDEFEGCSLKSAEKFDDFRIQKFETRLWVDTSRLDRAWSDAHYEAQMNDRLNTAIIFGLIIVYIMSL